MGTNWVQPLYDDSTWAQGAGRLGYSAPGITTTVGFGLDPSNMYVTTYFRQKFVVPAHVLYTNLNLRLNRADGAVVWLNGQELIRANLPAGPISFQTYATASVTNDALNTYYQTNLPVPVPFLPVGTNVLAVEIHKFSGSQPDLSFDMELFGLGIPAPQLTASLKGTNFDVRWPATNNAGYILVSGTNLGRPNTWSPLGGLTCSTAAPMSIANR